jgi:hypothetical protein
MPDFKISSETGKDNEKADIQQLEVPEDIIDTFGQYDEKPFVGVRRLLKRNPSLEFCREVVEMNKEELDPAEVKKVSSRYDELRNYRELIFKPKGREEDRLAYHSGALDLLWVLLRVRELRQL